MGHGMRHLVDELKARADEQIATMRDAALRARDTHARAELMRHMLMTASHVKTKPTAEAVAFIVDHWLEFEALYRGTCAPYTTLLAVREFLGATPG